ncbi:Pyridoxal phosphate-dependent decarboxylase [Corchorus capsularis]|uniref:Pyridoxal phosphate-dependent decarboxylase n=1 Tax=Corchorus capsularis TaxID=210143 RepID=A0A1R3JHH2_COCAP|nr:Pyridoxal phosphate-dependent decarboxylase [Corchorus capsularis]
MLCTSFNSVGFNWLASPASTELEMTVLDWLANMLKLLKSFMFQGTGGGVIQNTTSEAMLVSLIAARDKALDAVGFHNMHKLVVYASDQTHSTFAKVTVDSIRPLADVAKEHGLWVHVDAAYTGSACICPEFRHHLDGIERVDSLSLSPHKWLLSFLDCCCLWLEEPSLVFKTLSTNLEYLRNKQSESDSVVDFKDWQVGMGRRFKSLRLWLIFRSYGIANLQSHIWSAIRMAKMFEGFVKSDPRFEIVVPREFGLVCFHLKSDEEIGSDYTEMLNRKLLEWVNSTGRVYMTHTKVGGVYILRFDVGATLIEERHVVAAWKLIKEGADALLTCFDL